MDTDETVKEIHVASLDGKAVEVIADGEKQKPQTISNGCITLDTEASTVEIGVVI